MKRHLVLAALSLSLAACIDIPVVQADDLRVVPPDGSPLLVKRGMTNEDISVQRSRAHGPIRLALEGAPEGVSLAKDSYDEGSDPIPVPLAVAPSVMPGAPFTVTLRATGTTGEASAELTLQVRNPGGLLETSVEEQSLAGNQGICGLDLAPSGELVIGYNHE